VSSERLTAMGVGAACLGATIFFAISRQDAAHVRTANQDASAGRYAEAIQEAQRVHHAPADARALLLEAQVYAVAGRNRDASFLYGRLARRDPNNWSVHRDWSAVLGRLGDTTLARAELRRAERLNPRLLRTSGPGGG
jgi:Flp pilus assembly protein TadD